MTNGIESTILATGLSWLPINRDVYTDVSSMILKFSRHKNMHGMELAFDKMSSDKVSLESFDQQSRTETMRK